MCLFELRTGRISPTGTGIVSGSGAIGKGSPKPIGRIGAKPPLGTPNPLGSPPLGSPPLGAPRKPPVERSVCYKIRLR
jgi:hypothetical protein